MTLRTSEGFIVVEIDKAGKPTMRFWILNSDVDANVVARLLGCWNHDYNYAIRRANMLEFETK